MPTSQPTSQLAVDYMTEFLNIMQANSVNRAKVDWAGFRTQVMQKGAGAQTIVDLYPAITLALGLLADHHSFYQAPSGTYVNNPLSPRCAATAATSPPVVADIGYVRIASFGDSRPGAAIAFADTIENQIRSGDSLGLVGWIVDLRGNGGGDMWPMVAGVGSVLGEGVAGYFVLPTGASTSWGYRSGAAFNGTAAVLTTSAPYTLLSQEPKVAVLIDDAVASSGEALAVAFRGRGNTRSFGGGTCGLSTANQAYRLSDGASLYLTVGTMADRNGTLYGESLVPDEAVLGDVEVVQRAMAWLRKNGT